MNTDTKLRQLISPTPSEIDHHLRAITNRRFPDPGKRQEPFNPTEVLLCLAASRVVKWNSYGGQNIHSVPSPVPELAALFKRPPSSVTSKMGNLFGGRANKGVAETDAADWYLDEPARLVNVYDSILAHARALGLSRDSLPDFLPRDQRRWITYSSR